jgi:hypothetical protein
MLISMALSKEETAPVLDEASWLTNDPGLVKIAPAYQRVGAVNALVYPFSCPSRGPQDHEQPLKNATHLLAVPKRRRSSGTIGAVNVPSPRTVEAPGGQY